MNEAQNEEAFAKEGKYQKFQSVVERALKNFEVSSQWTDLVSHLSALHKMLLAYTQYPVVPLKYRLNRQLSQCLHHKLPHGVHLKTLDVYCAIFDRIKSDGLSADLHIYCSGLFPLMSFANISVRTRLLDVYEKYILPLGYKLVPALSGFVLGLLPGLEENSDHSERILTMIDRIWDEIGKTELLDALWNSIILSSGCRPAALNLVSSKLQLEQKYDKKFVEYDKLLSRAALQAGLCDGNNYTQRMTLDLLLLMYSFGNTTNVIFSSKHVATLLCPALCVLLRQDQSLTRRVYCWLLGDSGNNNSNEKVKNLTHPQDGSHDTNQCYFDAHVKIHVISALRVLLTTKDIVNCLKIVQYLFEKPSVCDSLKEAIMLDMAWGLYKQSLVTGALKFEDIQNVSKTRKKKKASNKIGLLRAANLLFQTFGEQFVWEWLEQFLKQSCDPSGCHGTVDDEEITVSTALQVMLLLVKLLPLESYTNHLPSLLTVLLNILLEHYSELMQQCLLTESLNIVKSLLSLLHNQSQKFLAPPSKSPTPISNHDCSPSPDSATNESTKEVEQITNGVGGASGDCKTIVGVADAIRIYLVLFPRLIFDACKVNHFDQSHSREWEGSREAIECCQCSCDLLVDFLSLPSSDDSLDVARGNHMTLPDWLNGLFSCCVIGHGIHDDDTVSYHHMMLQAISIFCHLLEEDSITMMIPQQMRSYIFHHTKFCQQASRILYECLVDVRLQPDASRLLHRLHTLVKPLAVCEMIALEEFSKHQDTVKPYQCYSMICQYTPHCKTAGNQPRPFLRAGLRMLEGLQSSSPTVRNFVQRWVEHACKKGNVDVLLSPVLALLNEIPVRRQHYKTLSSRSLNTCYQLAELVDTKRACFALNILTSLLEVGGAGLVQHFVGPTKQQQSHMLQDILSLLMAILLAEYSERMDPSEGELAAGLAVKCAVCNCLNELFVNFIKVIRMTKEDSNKSGSRFFLGLLFLCEVQKLLLLMLCELQEGLHKADSPSHESEPLLHSLLQAIGKILIVEFLSVLDDSSSDQKSFSPKKLNSALQKKTFIDANPLCSQPLFYALIMNACKNGQFCFLDMTLKYLPYFNPTHLVPQLLGIISELLRNSSIDCSSIHLLFAVVCLTRFVWQEELPFLTYTNLQPLLNHLNVPHFIPTLADQNIPRFKFPTRPCDPEVQSSNGGPISWLFSPIWNQRKSNDNNPTCGPLQEAILEQLPGLYGTLTLLWSRQDDELRLPWCSLNEPIIFEDVKLLVRELLLSPLTALPEAFMSTLAEMWMNWSSDVTEDRRTNFMTILHTIKLVELCDLLEYIKKTLLLLGQMENSDAGAVRQKYLLHFLYKYLSSSHQSADILEQCYSVVLTFLKDCHQHLSHPESICLLTSILHVLVCRTTSPVEKKIRRELQETVHLLCVSLSVAAGVATNQGYVWLQRNTAISVPHLLPSSSASSTPSSPRSPVHSSSPNLFRDEETDPSFPARRESSLELPNTISSATTSTLPIHHQLQMPTIQALAVLSNVLSQFVDYVYVEKEKDKITSLLSAILYHVWPHLSDHSPEHQLCYEHSLSLLTSLTEFSVARKSWKKETAALFLQPNYFNMPSSCIDSWLTIIDNLMAQDRTVMKTFMSQIKPLSVPLMTKEQLTKLAGLIKRLAFVLFAGETDQYEDLLQDMQDKLLESLESTVTLAQVLLCYHVMLLRFSPKQLQLIWPTITSESARICDLLCKDLQQLTGIQSATSHEEGLQYASFKPPSLSQCAVYINVCHLVHTMLMISMEQLPQFQHVRWYFEGTADDADILNGISSLCDKLDVESVMPKSLAVRLREIKSIVKRISNSLSTHRFMKSTSKHLTEAEETLKLMFLTN